MRLLDFVQLARPWQWTKNGVVLAGVIFSNHLFDPAYALRALLATAVFCLASSVIYVINDIMDREQDHLHPEKQDRPLAAGRVSVGGAWVWAGLLLIPVVVGSLSLGPAFMMWAAAFLVLNILYSLWLKRVVLVDVMIIAVSFVIRAIAGVAALWSIDPHVEISPWLLICTFFLALFLALGKRRHELALLEQDASDHRSSLGDYSIDFLDMLMSVVTAAVILAYAIYTVAAFTDHRHSMRMVYTLPLVVYGVFHYLHLIHHRHQGGNPSRMLYRDTRLLVTVLIWIAAAAWVIHGEAS